MPIDRRDVDRLGLHREFDRRQHVPHVLDIAGLDEGRQAVQARHHLVGDTLDTVARALVVEETQHLVEEAGSSPGPRPWSCPGADTRIAAGAPAGSRSAASGSPPFSMVTARSEPTPSTAVAASRNRIGAGGSSAIRTRLTIWAFWPAAPPADSLRVEKAMLMASTTCLSPSVRVIQVSKFGPRRIRLATSGCCPSSSSARCRAVSHSSPSISKPRGARIAGTGCLMVMRRPSSHI